MSDVRSRLNRAHTVMDKRATGRRRGMGDVRGRLNRAHTVMSKRATGGGAAWAMCEAGWIPPTP